MDKPYSVNHLKHNRLQFSKQGVTSMKQRIKLFNSGFTVTEVVIAVAIMSMVTAAAFGIFIAARKSWLSTSLAMSASRTANMAMARMVYGIGKQSGLRSAMGVG